MEEKGHALDYRSFIYRLYWKEKKIGRGKDKDEILLERIVCNCLYLAVYIFRFDLNKREDRQVRFDDGNKSETEWILLKTDD